MHRVKMYVMIYIGLVEMIIAWLLLAYPPNSRGASYNSYLLMDEKTVLFDTVDWDVCRQF